MSVIDALGALVFGAPPPPKPTGNPALDAALNASVAGITKVGSATTDLENYGEIADFLKTLTKAGAETAKCIAGKIGWAKLIALSIAAASGAGTAALVAAIMPHVVPCGAAAVASELGSSPLESAIKEAVAGYAKGQPGYINPKLQAQIDLLFSSGKAEGFFGTVNKLNKQELALFDLSTATKEAQEQSANVNTGLVLAAVVGGFLLLR